MPAPLEVAVAGAAAGAPLPWSATCRGGDQSPEISWGPVPAAATHAAVLVSSQAGHVHWMAWDADARAVLAPGIAATDLPPLQGRNSWGVVGWQGPCAAGGPGQPLPEDGPAVAVTVWLYPGPLGAPPTVGPAVLQERLAATAVARGRTVLSAPLPSSPAPEGRPDVP